MATPSSTDEALIDEARQQYAFGSDGDVNIDPWSPTEATAPDGGSLRVSRGDEGAYVQAWVYVCYSDMEED